MPEGYKKIRVFVASPNDVQPERDQLAKVIDEIDLTIDAITPRRNSSAGKRTYTPNSVQIFKRS